MIPYLLIFNQLIIKCRAILTSTDTWIEIIVIHQISGFIGASVTKED